jgi:hypothetical protein
MDASLSLLHPGRTETRERHSSVADGPTGAHSAVRCRADSAQIRQSSQCSGLNLQAEVVNPFQVVSSSLASEDARGRRAHRAEMFQRDIRPPPVVAHIPLYSPPYEG